MHSNSKFKLGIQNNSWMNCFLSIKYQMFCRKRKRIPCLAASTKEMRTSRPNKNTPIFFIITTIKFSHLLPKLWFSFGRSTKSAYNLPTQFSFKILLWGSAVHTHSTHSSLIAHHRENWFHDSFYLPLKFALSKYDKNTQNDLGK